MYNSVALSIFTLLYNQSPEFFHLAKLKLDSLNNSAFLPILNLWPTVLLYKFDYSR